MISMRFIWNIPMKQDLVCERCLPRQNDVQVMVLPGCGILNEVVQRKDLSLGVRWIRKMVVLLMLLPNKGTMLSLELDARPR
ncbi:hypothetical protein LINPERHAP1_LOCUS16035 [Linum perenne]